MTFVNLQLKLKYCFCEYILFVVDADVDGGNKTGAYKEEVSYIVATVRDLQTRLTSN